MLVTQAITAKLDFFHSRIDDFIVITEIERAPPNLTAVGFQNHPAGAEINGGEITLDWHLTAGLQSLFTWSFKNFVRKSEELDSSGQPLKFLYGPENQIAWGIYARPFDRIKLALEATWQDRYNIPDFYAHLRGFSSAIFDSFTYVNMRLDYQVPIPKSLSIDTLKMSLFLNNIGDEKAEETVLGFEDHMAGREAFLSISAEF